MKTSLWIICELWLTGVLMAQANVQMTAGLLSLSLCSAVQRWASVWEIYLRIVLYHRPGDCIPLSCQHKLHFAHFCSKIAHMPGEHLQWRFFIEHLHRASTLPHSLPKWFGCVKVTLLKCWKHYELSIALFCNPKMPQIRVCTHTVCVCMLEREFFRNLKVLIRDCLEVLT